MAEEEKTEEQADDWLAKLLKDDNEDDNYEEIQEDMDEEIAVETSAMKKIAHNMDEMQKKWDRNMLQTRTEKFLNSASDMEKDLFKAAAHDIKDIKTLDRVMDMVKNRAAEMDAQMKKYEEELAKEAEKRVQTAWGAPVGTGTSFDKEGEEEVLERIQKGDSKAALHKMFGEDKILGGYF